MYAAATTVTDLVHPSPRNHVIKLMPPSRARVHFCDSRICGDCKTCVYKTEMAGRA